VRAVIGNTFRNADCSSATAKATFNVLSNTGSPVVSSRQLPSMKRPGLNDVPRHHDRFLHHVKSVNPTAGHPRDSSERFDFDGHAEPRCPSGRN
jgi:hypothetical protein